MSILNLRDKNKRMLSITLVSFNLSPIYIYIYIIIFLLIYVFKLQSMKISFLTMSYETKCDR